MEQQTIQEEVKLTKKALNAFIHWSSSRYNNYCGYGTKKENVDTVYLSLKNGFYTDGRTGKVDDSKKVFVIQCASGVGESGSGRYWKTKGQGADEYTVNCETLTITTKYYPRSIKFKKDGTDNDKKDN